MDLKQYPLLTASESIGNFEDSYQDENKIAYNNLLFRKLTPEEEKQRHKHFEAFAKKVMGPGFIPLFKTDILDTYEQMKKHGKI